MPENPDSDLILAAYFGDTKQAQRALGSGASPDAVQKGTGFPALWLAVSSGHTAMVQMLLEHGADPYAKATSDDGQTFTALARAEAEGKEEIAELLRGARARAKRRK